jgi:hypothetical protein
MKSAHQLTWNLPHTHLQAPATGGHSGGDGRANVWCRRQEVGVGVQTPRWRCPSDDSGTSRWPVVGNLGALSG